MNHGNLWTRNVTLDSLYIAIKVNVVDEDIPLLNSVDVLDQNQLVADDVMNKLQSDLKTGHFA